MNYHSIKLTHIPTGSVTYTVYHTDAGEDAQREKERARVVAEIAEGNGHEPQDYRVAEPLGDAYDAELGLDRGDWKTLVDNLLESYNYPNLVSDMITKAFSYFTEQQSWKYFRYILYKLNNPRK